MPNIFKRSRLKSSKLPCVESKRVQQALDAGIPLRRIVPLQPVKVIKKAFWGLVVAVGGWIAASFLLWQFWLEALPLEQRKTLWAAWALVLVVLILWRTSYQLVYFFTYFYSIDDNNLTIRKGVLAQREINLPFSKITDVYIEQDLLDVAFGLYDVHFSSPTEQSGRVAHIDGVDKRGAVQLRNLLLERINSTEEAATEVRKNQKQGNR